MNIIKELWYGNIAPQDERNGLASLRASSRNNSPEMKQLMEYMSLAEAAIFEYAFKLGFRIAVESLK